jgi:hypothetical protein
MEVVFGDDKSIFVSTSPIETTSQLTGKMYGYRGVLGEFPEVGFKISPGTNSSSARSFTLNVPNEMVDALGIVRNGRVLAGLAEISLQVDGGDYDERYVIMRGSMDSGVTFGDKEGEMLTVSIVDPKEILSMNIPPYRVPEAWSYAGEGGIVPFTQTALNLHGTVVVGDSKVYGVGVFGPGGGIVGECAAVGGYSGRTYPPSAGVGKTYPIVWGYFPRVPCVPAVRDPHATQSTFGDNPSDEAFKSAMGWEDDADIFSWWVVAYGHGHKFQHWLSYNDGEVFFSVPQMKKDAEDRSGKEWDDMASVLDYPGSTEALVFSLYVDGERTRNQQIGSSSTYPGGEWAPDICILMEIADPNGVPVTVLKMSSLYGINYEEKVQLSMISSLGSELDPSTGTIWDGYSIVNAMRFFAKSFTTLGSTGIDEAMFAKAESRLGSLGVRGLVNGSGESSQATTISWIEGELLKGFPMVSMAFTGQGYGPVVIDRRTAISGEYIVGQWGIVGRTSALKETPKTKIQNDFTIRYDYDYDSDGYSGSITRNSGNSITCKISEEQCGRRSAPPVESLWIHDREVAAYCIDWLCEHLALPTYAVEYAADVWMMFKHTVGDNIKLTDEKLGFDETVCTIVEVKYTGERVLLGLLVWERYFTLSGGATNYPEPNLEADPIAELQD